MELLEKILLAIDFSKQSENLVKNAIGLAKTFQSRIFLVHVLPDNIKSKKARLLLEEEAIKQLELVKDWIKSEGVKTAVPVLEFGSPFDKILQTADSINANVIIVGSGEKSKNDVYQLGITVEKVIRKSDKPVWVVKKDIPLDINNILCPVDFSPESKRALRNTITIARRFQSELIVLSVNEKYYSGSLKIKIDWEEENEKAGIEHKKKFNSFLKGFNLSDINWDKEIKSGDPSATILDAIARHKTDLLIMGTTGKSGMKRIIMGSVTEKVIIGVPCSFMTMKSKDIIVLQLETKIRDIESHFTTAGQLMKDGFYKEAIKEFKICLDINGMHLPSLNGIATVYDKLGESKTADTYRKIAKDILSRIWDKKIEAEVRKFYKF